MSLAKFLPLLPMLALLSVGCGSRHGMHYNLMLDTSLSPEQVEETITAAQAWQDAVPGLTFDFSVTSCNSYQNRMHTVCIFLDNGDPSELAAGHASNALATTIWHHGTLADDDSPSADSSAVHLWAGNIANYQGQYAFRNIVQHELGHATSHDAEHLGQGHLMQPQAYSDKLEVITEDDVNFFWNAR